MKEQLYPSHFRLIESGRQPGAYNMALDEALWQTYADELAQDHRPPPILRFYGWQPAALSLGYTQRAEREVDFLACERLGIDWVRRPTGGRAILHDWGELTYSLVAAQDDPRLGGSVLESYRRISEALLAGLGRVGVAAELAGKDRRGSHESISAACFDAPSAYEVTWQGRKIIGSAQARQRGAILQQGTILLSVDVPRLFTVLRATDRAAAISQVAGRLTSIEAALGRAVSFEESQAAFEAAFATTFQAELHPDRPTPAEAALTTTLQAAKYANPTWNMERQRPVRA